MFSAVTTDGIHGVTKVKKLRNGGYDFHVRPLVEAKAAPAKVSKEKALEALGLTDEDVELLKMLREKKGDA